MADFEAARDVVKRKAETLDRPQVSTSGEEQQAQGRLAPGAELALELPRAPAGVRTLGVKSDPRDAPQVLRSAVLEATFDGGATIWCPGGGILRVWCASERGSRLVSQRRKEWPLDVSLDHALSEVSPNRPEKCRQTAHHRYACPHVWHPGRGTSVRCTSMPTGDARIRSRPGRCRTGTIWRSMARASTPATR